MILLISGTWWEKKTKTTPFRCFAEYDDSVSEASRLTRVQKANMLELMLRQITNYCPVISRNNTSIVKNSTQTDQIWQTIRLHYGF